MIRTAQARAGRSMDVPEAPSNIVSVRPPAEEMGCPGLSLGDPGLPHAQVHSADSSFPNLVDHGGQPCSRLIHEDYLTELPGATSSTFVRALSKLIASNKPNVLVLLEPHVWRCLRRFHFSQFLAMEARGFSGGIWCFWDEESAHCEFLEPHSQCLSLMVLRDSQLL